MLPVPGPAAPVLGWVMYLPAYQLLRQRGRQRHNGSWACKTGPVFPGADFIWLDQGPTPWELFDWTGAVLSAFYLRYS